MNELKFEATIDFYPGKKAGIPSIGYRPHIVMDDDQEKEYLGIVFEKTDFENDYSGTIVFLCLYYNLGVNYNKIVVGESFEIFEGGTAVAKGIITANNNFRGGEIQ